MFNCGARRGELTQDRLVFVSSQLLRDLGVKHLSGEPVWPDVSVALRILLTRFFHYILLLVYPLFRYFAFVVPNHYRLTSKWISEGQMVYVVTRLN